MNGARKTIRWAPVLQRTLIGERLVNPFCCARNTLCNFTVPVLFDIVISLKIVPTSIVEWGYGEIDRRTTTLFVWGGLDKLPELDRLPVVGQHAPVDFYIWI